MRSTLPLLAVQSSVMQWSALTIWLTMVTTLVVALHGTRTVDARKKRTLYGSQCPRGCRSCSAANGCVTCKSRFFLYLRRNHMRQMGLCVLSCPLHHYGTRNRGFNYCAKCKIKNCDVCFNKNYCTRCIGELVEHRGQCIDQCPDGTTIRNETRQCLPKVHCVVGEWSPWGVCAKKGQTCGFKYGIQTRVREMVQLPSSSGGRCPPTTDNRRCRMIHRVCPEIISNESEFSEAELTNQRKGNGKRMKKKRNRLQGNSNNTTAFTRGKYKRNKLNELLM